MTTLDHLITSRTLTKVIRHFCNYDKPLTIRELARRIQEDPGNTHRMIERLEKAGIVASKDDGYHKKYLPVEGHALDCLRYLHS